MHAEPIVSNARAEERLNSPITLEEVILRPAGFRQPTLGQIFSRLEARRDESMAQREQAVRSASETRGQTTKLQGEESREKSWLSAWQNFSGI